MGKWRRAGTALGNVFSKGLNASLTGLVVEREPFAVMERESLAYALACSDANPAYFRKEGAVVPPLFSARILKDALEEVLLHPELGMNVLRMVHAEQAFRFNEPVRVGMAVVPWARMAGIRQVSTGQILDVECRVVERGRVLTEGTASVFMRQRGGGEGGGVGKKEGRKEGGAKLEVVETFTPAKDQPERYALASRDCNPLHRSWLVARLAGFRGPIMHGMCVLAMTASRLTARYGGNSPAMLASLRVRFSAPAYPGEELTLRVAQDKGSYRFMVQDSRARPVLSMGEVSFR